MRELNPPMLLEKQPTSPEVEWGINFNYLYYIQVWTIDQYEFALGVNHNESSILTEPLVKFINLTLAMPDQLHMACVNIVTKTKWLKLGPPHTNLFHAGLVEEVGTRGVESLFLACHASVLTVVRSAQQCPHRESNPDSEIKSLVRYQLRS